MTTINSVIAVTAGIILLYLMSVLLESPIAWLLGLFWSSMAATVWMAVKILEDPCSADKTIENYFYQHRENLHRHENK